MKSLLKSFVACAVLCGFAAVAVAEDEIIDITAKLRDESGVTLTLVEGTKYNANSVDNLFTADSSASGRALFKTRDILVQYDVKDAYEPDKDFTITSYELRRPGTSNFDYDKRMPTQFELRGSTDGETWTVIASGTYATADWHNNDRYTVNVPVENQAPYRHYRFWAGATTSTDANCYFNLQQVIFYGTVKKSVSGKPSVASVEATREGDEWTVSVTLSRGKGDVSVVLTDIATGAVTTNLVEAGVDATVAAATAVWTATGMAADHAYRFAALAVNGEITEGENASYLDGAGSIYNGTARASIGTFAKRFTVSVPDSVTEPLTNFPLLVRISSDLVPGYRGEDVYQAGRDIVAAIGPTVLDSELQRFDPNGETLLWVKVPELTADTLITVYYSDYRILDDVAPDPQAAWSDYAGVWHLDEPIGGQVAVADASGATTGGEANPKSTVIDQGVLGRARSMGTLTDTNGPLVLVPRSERLDLAATNFTVSGWVNVNGEYTKYGWLFSRKTVPTDAAYGLQFGGDSGRQNNVRVYGGKDYRLIGTSYCFPAGSWIKYEAVYDAKRFRFYLGGALKYDNELDPNGKGGVAIAGTNDFAIGGLAGGFTSDNTLNAISDEVKVRLGSVSAKWAEIEYLEESDAHANTYGAAIDNDSVALFVASDTAGIGAPEPGYGEVTGLARGETRHCVAREFFRDDKCYINCGYVIETSADGGITWGNPVTNRGDEATFDYTYEGTPTKLTWLWRVHSYRLRPTADFGEETFTYSPASVYVDPADPLSGWFVPGTPVTVTPHAASEPTRTVFREWEEPRPAGATVSGETISLTVPGEPLWFNAGFDRLWTFVEQQEGEEYPTITDGNWELYVTRYSGTKIDGVQAPYRTALPSGCDNAVKAGSGLLDFTTVNADLAALGQLPFKHLTSDCFKGVAVTGVIIPADVPSAYNSPFKECGKLRFAKVYPNLELWQGGGGVFRQCSALADVEMPNATLIPEATFCYCTSLEHFDVADTVTNICNGAFTVTKLRNLRLPSRLQRIGEYAFLYTASGGSVSKYDILRDQGDIVFPKTFESLGSETFRYAGLTGLVDFAATRLTTIPEKCFSSVSFKRVVLPASVTTVEPYAFNVAEKNVDKVQLGELCFLGLPPTFERNPDWPDSVVWNQNREWDLIVRPRRDDLATLAAWRALPNFTDKEDCMDLESKKNYETVSKMKGFIGVLDNSWVVTWVPPSAGMKVLIR